MNIRYWISFGYCSRERGMGASPMLLNPPKAWARRPCHDQTDPLPNIRLIAFLFIAGLLQLGCSSARPPVSAFEPIQVADLGGFRPPTGDWKVFGAAAKDPSDEKHITTQPGTGVLFNGNKGTVNILTTQAFGDCEVHVEFMVPKGSNSGVYFEGRYEIQILDSFGVEHPKYEDCGGIYQRWRDKPTPGQPQGYEGRPPKTNASLPPGEWQSFDVIFHAPRFDANGKKTENAKFVKVMHNGKLIHENAEVTGPTRSGTYEDEAPKGPLMLQGNHGPVAFRNIRIRPAE